MSCRFVPLTVPASVCVCVNRIGLRLCTNVVHCVLCAVPYVCMYVCMYELGYAMLAQLLRRYYAVAVPHPYPYIVMLYMEPDARGFCCAAQGSGVRVREGFSGCVGGAVGGGVRDLESRLWFACVGFCEERGGTRDGVDV